MGRAIIHLLLPVLMMEALVGCGSSSAPSDGTSSDSNTTPATSAGGRTKQIVGGVPAGAFPSDVVVAAISAGKRGGNDPDGSGTYFDYMTLAEENWKRLSTSDPAECGAVIDRINSIEPSNCYGPALDFQGHPDDGAGEGSFTEGSLTIWNRFAENQEACTAAQMDYLTGRLRSISGSALKVIRAATCAANVSSLTLPDSAEVPLDITASAESEISNFIENGEVVLATTSLLESDSQTATYLNHVEVNLDDGTQITADLTHTRLAVDNSLFRGRFSYIWSGLTADNVDSYAGSLGYEKSESGVLKTESKQGRYDAETDLTEIIDDTGNLVIGDDYKDFIWNLTTINPTDGNGTSAFAWTNSPTDTNVHSLIGSLERADKVDTFCAYAGFGDSLAALDSDPTNSYWIDRMVCNFGGPEVDTAGILALQKQCSERGIKTGSFSPTESNIRYVPRNSCGADGEVNDDFTWRFHGDDAGFVPFLAPNTLVPISEIDLGDISVPETPITD
jgi:hypothetical protein